MKKIYFVTGVSGIGKTTLIQYLRPLLGNGFEIHDFDERGVPNNAGRQWRLDETQYWINLGLKNFDKGIRTIICGFARPSEQNNPSVYFILLDADEETIQQRLWSRYQTPESIAIIEKVSGKSIEQFIQDNMNFLRVMKTEAIQHGIPIINTNRVAPQGVAAEVAKQIVGV